MSATSVGTTPSSLCDAITVEGLSGVLQTHFRSTKALLNRPWQDDDVESHRERIGPIARLNLDELMAIFEFCSDVYWTAPLSISRVCREWRSIILATPRAWANLHLPARPPRNIISLYVTRSQPLLLHVISPSATNYHLGYQPASYLPYIQVIDAIAERVECLTILSTELPLLTRPLLSLQRLHLHRRPLGKFSGTPFDIGRINRSTVPKLCHLDLEGVEIPPTDSHSSLIFPSIQQVILWTDFQCAWYGLIGLAANSLVSLHLRLHYASHATATEPLYLPVLRYLHILNEGHKTWEFAAKTPSLISYIPPKAFVYGHTISDELALSVNVDIAQVTHLRLLEDIDLSPYTTLRYLQTCFSPGNIIQRLEQNPNLCQHLETIEWYAYETPMATKIDREILGITRQLQIIKAPAWNRVFPFCISNKCSDERGCSPRKAYDPRRY